MDIFKQLYELYPDLEEEYKINNSHFELFEVRDDANGYGPYIAQWNHPALTRPTQSQIPTYHDYKIASERLSQYILSVGREEITKDVIVSTEEVWNEETEEYDTVNTTETVIIQTAIEPLEATVEVTTIEETMESTTETVPNPIIVKDEEERAAAQSVVDATPQSVINSINT